jgi:hypothetical protein
MSYLLNNPNFNVQFGSVECSNIQSSGNIVGDLTGNVTGDVLGNLTGDVLGNLTGNVLGNVTGNLTGNVLGDVAGNSVSIVSSGNPSAIPPVVPLATTYRGRVKLGAGGAVLVNNDNITVNSTVLLSYVPVAGGAIANSGALSVHGVNANANFTIQSSNNADVNEVDFIIIN